jgi:hypothetical protein
MLIKKNARLSSNKQNNIFFGAVKMQKKVKTTFLLLGITTAENMST